MRLDTLVRTLRGAGEAVRVVHPSKLMIRGIADDSRRVQPGFLFAAMPGSRADGTKFVHDSLARGAHALLVQAPVAGMTVPQVVSPTLRRSLGLAAAAFCGEPSRRMRVYGVTGTNGKSTSASLLREVLETCGVPCGLIGTVQNIVGSEVRPAKLTTPGPLEIQQMLAEMLAAGQSACAMEVSSHALDQDRVAGVDFAGSIFTNLTRDHLDYHREFEQYFAAKARLFTALRADAAGVFNLDDEYGQRMMARCAGRAVGFRFGGGDWRIENARISVEGLAFELAHGCSRLAVTSPMTGRYNVQNVAGVVALALECGLAPAPVLEAVAAFRGAPGRLERVPCASGPAVFVDYAHSPDAMENVLSTLRQVCAGRRLTVVFGCGGDRDRTKRPRMGAIASRLADRVVVTSDNPRGENPAAIIDEILAGVPRTEGVTCQAERREAIRGAIASAAPGEVVAILGKGHEDYQIYSDRTVHFDDKEEALSALHDHFGVGDRAAA